MWAFSGLGYDNRAFRVVRKPREKIPPENLTLKRNDMILLIISFVSLLVYMFMIGFTEGERVPWICAALMAFNWFLSESTLYAIRHG